MACTNPIICDKHGTLVSLNEHSDNIFRFFLSDNPYDEDPVRDWFKVCSGITQVGYSSTLFDYNYFFCGPVLEYADARSKQLSSLLLQLTWFTYIWGGFEAYIDSLELSPCPHQRGKFNAVNHFLITHYEPHFNTLAYYNNLVTLLTNYLKAIPSYNADGNLFNSSACAGKSGQGLTIVYKIRNQFAHGAFAFSEPNDDKGQPSYDDRIIHISCRIILLTIQMLLLAIYKDNAFNIEKRNELHEKGTLNSTDFLQNLHILGYET